MKDLALPFKKTLSNLKNKLSSSVLHNILRAFLITHIVVTAYLPTVYVKFFQHLAVRVIIALLVVALLFWDIVSGALLAILLVLTIQEAKSRSVLPKNNSGNNLTTSTTLSTPNNKTNNDISRLLGDAKKLLGSVISEAELVAPSVYQELSGPTDTKNDQIGAYMKQIGDLSITAEIKAGQGVQMVDGVASVKNNMGQTQTANAPGLLMPAYGKEGMEAGTTTTTGTTTPTVNLGTEYDHPANKTLSENLRSAEVGFITPQHLLDAQNNRILGAGGCKPVCAVESASGIWNAQGFGGITRALDNEDCPHSFV